MLKNNATKPFLSIFPFSKKEIRTSIPLNPIEAINKITIENIKYIYGDLFVLIISQMLPNGLAKTSGRLLYVDVYIFSNAIFQTSFLTETANGGYWF